MNKKLMLASVAIAVALGSWAVLGPDNQSTIAVGKVIGVGPPGMVNSSAVTVSWPAASALLLGAMAVLSTVTRRQV